MWIFSTSALATSWNSFSELESRVIEVQDTTKLNSLLLGHITILLVKTTKGQKNPSYIACWEQGIL